MAAILWKIKQRYDMFRRRQRLFFEMEQMASRPFSQVCCSNKGKHNLQLNFVLGDTHFTKVWSIFLIPIIFNVFLGYG